MGYYDDIRRANLFIDEEIKRQIYQEGKSLKVDELKLSITSTFAVGEKIVDKRIATYLKVKSDLRLLDGELFTVG